jgi:putative transposase
MIMPYDPNRHHRRSIRLRGYDYAQAGAYFVTICTQDRWVLFGGIDGGALRLNDAGRMVERWWGELNHKFPIISTDAFVVMPDHIHGIIVVGASGGGNNAGDDPNVGDDSVASPSVGANLYIRPPRNPNDRRADNANIVNNDVDAADADPNAGDVGDDADVDGYINPPLRNDVSLSVIIQWFKIMTTTEYIRHVKQSGWTPFNKRVWQRNYYERIIRDQRQLNATRRYILENPARLAEGRDDIDALLARMQVKE